MAKKNLIPSTLLHRLTAITWRYRHIVAALGACLIVIGITSTVSAYIETRAIVITTESIGVGERIERSVLKVRYVAAKDLPTNVASSVESILGRYATVRIPQGALIVSGMYRDTLRSPPGTQIVSIPIHHLSASVVQQGARIELFTPPSLADGLPEEGSEDSMPRTANRFDNQHENNPDSGPHGSPPGSPQDESADPVDSVPPTNPKVFQGSTNTRSITVTVLAVNDDTSNGALSQLSNDDQSISAKVIVSQSDTSRLVDAALQAPLYAVAQGER
ncbi:MAG: SAF domain-containing protein [Actinomycetaceae bacterium]|nr:SAF domain-containing protein [Actinomycetaceae bacterium]MDO5746982.1 SAF domain-containing protein [Actinomycetaceae bacterium]